MTTVIKHDVQQNSKEWFALRSKFVSSTTYKELAVNPQQVQLEKNKEACDKLSESIILEKQKLSSMQQQTAAGKTSKAYSNKEDKIEALIDKRVEIEESNKNDHEANLFSENAYKLGTYIAASKIYGSETRPLSNFQTPSMKEGVEGEAIAAELYAQNTFSDVEECGMFSKGILASSPDRIVGQDGLLEIKTINIALFMKIYNETKGNESGGDFSETAHENYSAQIFMHLAASGRDYCDLVIFNKAMNRYFSIRYTKECYFKQIKDAQDRVAMFDAHVISPILNDILTMKKELI